MLSTIRSTLIQVSSIPDSFEEHFNKYIMDVQDRNIELEIKLSYRSAKHSLQQIEELLYAEHRKVLESR